MLLTFLLGHAISAALMLTAHVFCRSWHFLARYALGILCGLAGIVTIEAIRPGSSATLAALVCLVAPGAYIVAAYAPQLWREAIGAAENRGWLRGIAGEGERNVITFPGGDGASTAADRRRTDSGAAAHRAD